MFTVSMVSGKFNHSPEYCFIYDSRDPVAPDDYCIALLQIQRNKDSSRGVKV